MRREGVYRCIIMDRCFQETNERNSKEMRKSQMFIKPFHRVIWKLENNSQAGQLDSGQDGRRRFDDSG